MSVKLVTAVTGRLVKDETFVGCLNLSLLIFRSVFLQGIYSPQLPVRAPHFIPPIHVVKYLISPQPSEHTDSAVITAYPPQRLA